MPRATTLTSVMLLKAGVYYHHENEESSYADLVLRHGATSPKKLASAAVRFAGKWGASHYTQRKKRQRKMAAVLPRWFKENRSIWEPLREKNIIDFEKTDDRAVYLLASSLYQDCDLGSTEYGKLMHFISPIGVVMWDDKWVRKNYGLEEGPREFVFYQRVLRALLEEVGDNEGRRVLNSLQKQHHTQTGCSGGIPKLLDEAVYHRATRNRIKEWINRATP
jgi:hypothetical protein